MKAILFDVDGTLTDNVSALYSIYDAFLRHCVCEGSYEEFVSLAGASLREIVLYLKNKYHIAEDVEKLYQHYHSTLHEEYSKKTPLFPGVKEFIHKMHKANIRLGVVSGAVRSLLESFLDAHHFTSLFEVVVAGDDVSRGKPDPAIYKLALAKLALPAHEVIVIEDALNGVRAAIGAGIPTILLTHTDPECWNEVQNWHTELVTPAADWKEVAAIIRKKR